jgi:hypothetical protein
MESNEMKKYNLDVDAVVINFRLESRTLPSSVETVRNLLMELLLSKQFRTHCTVINSRKK